MLELKLYKGQYLFLVFWCEMIVPEHQIRLGWALRDIRRILSQQLAYRYTQI